MSFSPIGDMAQSLMLRRQGSTLRNSLSSLTLELSSGRKSNLSEALNGNYTSLSALEHSLKLQDGYDLNRKSLQPMVDTAQLALGSMQDTIAEAGGSILSAAISDDPIRIQAISAQGRGMLSDIVGFANSSQAGRYIFSGKNTNVPPLPNIDDLLTQVEAAVSGMGTAATFDAALDTFFNDPAGGYATLIYAGDEARGTGVQVSTGTEVIYSVTAENDGIKNTIRHAVALTLIDEGGFQGSSSERNALLESIGSGLIASNQSLIGVQADIGQLQERIDQADTQSDRERQMFEQLKSGIVDADPYRVATQLTAVQTQLESLYVITSRTSRLNLSEYLR